MDGKKAAGWLVLAAIAVVAAAALATTHQMTQGPISQRQLGENQAVLEGMFPDADAGAAGFEALKSGEGVDSEFAYAVRRNGQPWATPLWKPFRVTAARLKSFWDWIPP